MAGWSISPRRSMPGPVQARPQGGYEIPGIPDPNAGLNYMATDRDNDITNRQNRLGQIQERQRQFPGSRPGGSGLTGLNKHDSKGWAQMLDDQRFAAEAQSGQPLQVRGGQTPAPPPSFAELYQQSPDFFHSKNAKTGDYQYNPRSLYEQNALDHLRRWKG